MRHLFILISLVSTLAFAEAPKVPAKAVVIAPVPKAPEAKKESKVCRKTTGVEKLCIPGHLKSCECRKE